MASTARELGVEVNNFSQTRVGKIALFLIVWHLFGGMVVHVKEFDSWVGAHWFFLGVILIVSLVTMFTW